MVEDLLLERGAVEPLVTVRDDVIVIGHGKVLFQGTLDGLRSHAGEGDLEEAFIQVIGEDHLWALSSLCSARTVKTTFAIAAR